MSPSTIFGVVVLLVGILMASDPKTIGFKTSAPGFAVAGAGFFIIIYSTFGASRTENYQRSGRKFRDYSV
jgi:hypothetical protein